MVRSLRQREAKQEKRNKMLLSGIIVILMVGSTIGFFFGSDSDPNKLEFKAANGKTYDFVRGNGLFATKINGKETTFYYYPTDVQNLNFSDEAVNIIKNAQVIGITFDPESTDVQFFEQARFDMAQDFAVMQKYAAAGVTKNFTGYENFMEFDCANSTLQVPIIEFISANTSSETRAYVGENSCIILEGKKYDFLKFRDYIAYKINGLI